MLCGHRKSSKRIRIFPSLGRFLVLSLLIFLLGVPTLMAQHETEHKFTNHLAGQTSPYLLQHQHNPVNWYPWGPEAIAKSKEEDKPIFLSIGYSACHWCHVMEHESFENEQIATLLNASFVSIKVDREERPDLDEIYMAATQLLTRGGGWPMSVFLTPDLEPFYAGTYFPPTSNYGRPGFSELISQLASHYKTQRAEVDKNADRIADAVRHHLASDTSSATVTEKAVDRAVATMKQRFDPVWGGFGGAPKFPHTMDLMLLMRDYRDTGDEEALRMVTHSLDKMARGGMYDQIGGGFHRYSVDAQWLIPHFEKMLYDNALLAKTYLEGGQVTGNDWYTGIAAEIFDYVIREMQDSDGGYYSSTDADSEGEEGIFFIWTPEEIEQVLGEEDGKVVCAYYSVEKGGNFEGKTTLWIPKDPAEVAKELGIPIGRLSETLERSKPKLYAERAKRIPPGLDDKILTDWNGLMISSMAFGAFVLDEPRYLESAKGAAAALLEHQWDGDVLLHTRRQGKSHLTGMLSDYANTVMGLIDLYLASGEATWLASAIEIHKSMIEKFEDKSSGGFFNTIAGQADLLVRTKTGSDGATPSGNSVAALNAIRLAALTGDASYQEQGTRTFLAFGQALTSQGLGHPLMLNAVDFHHHGAQELVLVGPDSGAAKTFLDPLRAKFAPYLVWVKAGEEGIEQIAPIVKGKEPLEGKPTAYLCRDQACQAPTTDPSVILEGIK